MLIVHRWDQVTDIVVVVTIKDARSSHAAAFDR
jgi:hypothetical protein